MTPWAAELVPRIDRLGRPAAVLPLDQVVERALARPRDLEQMDDDPARHADVVLRS